VLRNSRVSHGSEKSRLPVAAKIALVTAGATGGTPGSPIPLGGACRHQRDLRGDR